MNVTFRPAVESDAEFLYEVYAGTRQEEMQLLPWDDRQKEGFLRMQFNAQRVHYQSHYGDARFDLILLDGTPVGRLYVHRADDAIRVVDISLLPPFRGRGLGGGILQGILDEAGEAGLPVRLHVEKQNPAVRLYGRLGFRTVEDAGVYDLMEWRAD